MNRQATPTVWQLRSTSLVQRPQEIARNVADASSQASDARHEAEDGGKVVQQAIRSMSELSDKISDACAKIEMLNRKTVDIGQILEVPKSIFRQNSLLALNAAIEHCPSW